MVDKISIAIYWWAKRTLHIICTMFIIFRDKIKEEISNISFFPLLFAVLLCLLNKKEQHFGSISLFVFMTGGSQSKYNLQCKFGIKVVQGREESGLNLTLKKIH